MAGRAIVKSCVLSIFVFLTGCCHKMTPNVLQQDAMSYNDALHYTINSQLLLNIVRLHYKESTTFLQIGIISSAYENKNAFGLDGEFEWTRPVASSTSLLAPKIAVERTEKPTTTFQHVRGEDFVTQFLSPIKLRSLALLNASGWELERLLRCCVQRINDLYNDPDMSRPGEDGDSETFPFIELCRKLDKIERKGGVHFSYNKDPQTGERDLYLSFNEDLADPDLLNEVKMTLGLNLDENLFRIVVCHGSRRCLENELSMDLRSPLSIFYFLSHGVETPFIHKQQKFVSSTFRDPRREKRWKEYLKDLFDVKASPNVPFIFPSSLAYYRGNVFYIDESDLQTKSSFVLLSQILSLQVNVPELPSATLTLPLN